MIHSDFNPLVQAIVPNKIPVFVLVGHPYCGKSTFLDNFAEMVRPSMDPDLCIMVLDSDSYVKTYASGWRVSYDEAFEQYGASANRLYKEDVKSEGDMPYDPNLMIFIDRTNMSVKSRQHIIKGFWNRDVHSLIAVVFPMLDDETIKERMEDRPDQVVPMEVIQNMKDKYEEPTVAEGFDKVISIT